MTKTIYCDESGFTGYNLLDREQPVFTVASHDIDETRAAEILSTSFPRYRAQEYKFANIWSTANRAGLVEFARHLSNHPAPPFVYMVDKKFAALVKLIDYLIEPQVTGSGHDFYGNGFCWKYSNMVHFGMEQFAPRSLDVLLENYMQFSRNPSSETLAVLHRQLVEMASSADERVGLFLEQMELGARLFDWHEDLASFRSSNELHVTSMLGVISYWRQRFTDDIAVVHDASANFFRRKDVWDTVTSENVPEQDYRLGDGSCVEFPLRVTSTTAMDSVNNRSVQLSDVLAGITARHFSFNTQGDERRFVDEVIEAGLKFVEFDGVRPGTVFPDPFPPGPLDGPDVLDQMVGIMSDD